MVLEDSLCMYEYIPGSTMQNTSADQIPEVLGRYRRVWARESGQASLGRHIVGRRRMSICFAMYKPSAFGRLNRFKFEGRNKSP